MAESFLNRAVNKYLRTSLPLARYALKIKRKHKLKVFESNQEKVLEICGGIAPVSAGNLNVDIFDDPKVDVLADLLKPLPFGDLTIDKIISIATLMHLGLNDMRKILTEFLRILKPGGRLEIGLPSLEKIVAYYKANGLDDVCLRHLHGAQKNQYDLHLLVMDFNRFSQELTVAGFINIKESAYDFPTQDPRFYMKITAEKIS